jgi:hypothetical protein
MTQIITLKILNNSELMETYESEYFLEIESAASIGFEDGEWTPDARIKFMHKTINIEVELNQKYGVELEKKLATIIRHINIHEKSCVEWHSKSKSILKSYSDLAMKGVPSWRKSRDTNWTTMDYSIDREKGQIISLDDPTQWFFFQLEKDPRTFL